MYHNRGSLFAYVLFLPYFGGFYGDGTSAGAFCLRVSSLATGTDAYVGGRLMFL